MFANQTVQLGEYWRNQYCPQNFDYRTSGPVMEVPQLSTTSSSSGPPNSSIDEYEDFCANLNGQNNFLTPSQVVDALQESALMNSTLVSQNSTVSISQTQAHQNQQNDFLPEVTDQNNFQTPSPVMQLLQGLMNSTLVPPIEPITLPSTSPILMHQYQQQYNFHSGVTGQNNFGTPNPVVNAAQGSLLMNFTYIPQTSPISLPSTSPTLVNQFQLQKYNSYTDVNGQNDFRTPSPVLKPAKVNPLANSTSVPPTFSTSLQSIPTQLHQYHQQKYNFHSDFHGLNVNFRTTNPVVSAVQGSSTTVSPSVSSTFTTETTSPTLNTPPTPESKSTSKKRSRTSFSNDQLIGLEIEFLKASVLQRTRRILLSQRLNLSEKQIRVWFQNRRMKMQKTDVPNAASVSRTMHSEVQSVGEPNLSYTQYPQVNNTNMGNSQKYSWDDPNLLEHMHNVLNGSSGQGDDLNQWLNN